MFYYWILPLALSVPALIGGDSPFSKARKASKVYLYFTFIYLVLFIGLRDGIGTDWVNYNDKVLEQLNSTWLEVFESKDFGYTLVSWIGANFGGGVYFANTICAFIFSLGLVTFCRRLQNPLMGIILAVPYLVTVVAMGYTRQSASVGIMMILLSNVSSGLQAIKSIFLVVFATSFHKSAVVLFLMLLPRTTNHKFLRFILLPIAFFLSFIFLVIDYIESLHYIYLERELASGGALYRLLLSAIPATIFLILRSRSNLGEYESKIWTWMSYFSLIFLVFAIFIPATTFIDRVALYLIPLQMYVYTELPVLLRMGFRTRIFYNAILIVYCFTTLSLWLLYSSYAEFAWIPYKSYIFLELNKLL